MPKWREIGKTSLFDLIMSDDEKLTEVSIVDLDDESILNLYDFNVIEFSKMMSKDVKIFIREITLK